MQTAFFAILFNLLFLFNGCSKPATVTQKPTHTPEKPAAKTTTPAPKPMQTGAAQLDKYLPLLQNKQVGLVVNQTSLVGNTHLVDTLLSRNITIKTIFAPEHGFRGQADAGAHISHATDAKTGLPILSLYGKNKKPSAGQLQGLDIVVFDIQDVGARFYTYISTMHYVMEACAENNIPVVVLDRPNPNGFYVDGPVLDMKYRSFVGMHPIPVVHGLTVGELANMINGEKWLAGGKTASLTVVPLLHYNHNMRYSLPVKPSPNLPNDLSVLLYPSLCLIEPAEMSVGRGTPTPFQLYGSPFYADKSFSFTPRSMEGAAKPPFMDQVCYGRDLRNIKPKAEVTLEYLLDAYQKSTKKENFFHKDFEILAGTGELRQQVLDGLSEADIKATWQPKLDAYKQMRKKYLLYPDFN